MAGRPRVAVIGAGLVGCALADELTELGWTDVTVLGGGDPADVPGLVFRTHEDRTLTEFAKYTVAKYAGLDGEWCFNPVGSLEVATTRERLEELKQRHGWATSWGVRGFLRTPHECADLHPLVDGTRVLGGLHVPGDGLLHARRAAEAQARRAKARGVRFAGEDVLAIDTAGGRVTGVVTTAGRFRADVVVSCADAGKLVGLNLPRATLTHDYAMTPPLPGLEGRNDDHVQAGLPVLRHLESGMYVREHVDRLGAGITADAGLVPALRDAETVSTVVVPAGQPLIGEHPSLDGFWVAEAVRAEHSAGVARELARWLVEGQPALALHGCDPARFVPGPARHSPFHERQAALGARFGSAGGWARPERYSSDVGAEVVAARERVVVVDLTSVPRLAVTGPGALPFLQAMTTGDVADPGTVTETLLLNEAGGVRGCLTVARLGADRFHVGASSRLDFDWLRRHLPGDGTAQLHDTTPGTCCLGVWGPRAGEVLPELSTTDFSAAETYLGDVPVVALRLSTVGEPGWELHTTADLGRHLWDTLRDRGVVPAGHQAFTSLRLEAGGRVAGVDFTTEHNPYEAGLGHAVRFDKGYFLGRDALTGLSAATVSRRLTRLTAGKVLLGKEPVYVEGQPAGYVTSAGYGYTAGETLAYAWLPVEHSTPGTPVEIEHFGTRVPGRVS
ncbi:FAD-dependent oxidoreductase [Amycolatopsis sp. OK19-0408]|uniref:FAD-dependent oxidoreductase n=1 Tax=Amycolatopsis iheyensis TaxID=2945988 RepID=A0A9X2N691_9PSEU|nr:FAD-dependent oxidoreductase [Amycolatopsis iheyensis]MCR6481588.1 FAD-dependent oxidoreductase [Amycolatopsis iheyensis]